MKTTKILLGALRVSALVAVVLAFAASAQAQVVNVDFIAAPWYTNLGTYTGLGAASNPGTYWNAVSVTYGASTFTSSSPLLASDGVTSSTVSFTLTSPAVGLYSIDRDTGLPSSETSFANPLLAQWVDPGTAGQGTNATHQAIFTISGLTDGGTYNLFLYSQNGPDATGVTQFTVGATSLTATNTSGDNSSFVDNGNYVEFASLTASGSGVISGTWYDPSGGSGLNGFQIQTVVTEAPEPSTLATMSLVGIALLVLRKRFKKQSI